MQSSGGLRRRYTGALARYRTSGPGVSGPPQCSPSAQPGVSLGEAFLRQTLLLGVKLEASDLRLWMMTCKWSRRCAGVGCHVSFRVLRAAGTSPGINNVKTPEVSHSERLPSVHRYD